MARLPSLQQISSRLNPGSSPTLSATDGAASSTGKAAPKLSLSTNVPTSASTTSPFASSPSGRLKMPISAMKRTQSQQGGAAGQTTPLAESSTASSFFNTTESFASPAIATASLATPMTAGQSIPAPPPLSRGMSVDGFIKGYRDVPSLAQISKHVNGKAPSLKEEAEKDGIPSKESVKEVKEESKEAAPATVEPATKVTETPSLAAPTRSAVSQGQDHPLQHTW